MPKRIALALFTLGVAAAVLAWLVPGVSTTRAQSVPAAGCDPAREHAAGDSNETIDSGGMTRQYILYVPPSYTGAEAVPLVFLFHGLGQGYEGVYDYTELYQKADEEGFVIAVPQGTVGSILATLHWNFLIFLRDLDPNEPDDVAFIGDLLDSLETELCIDSARVFATGISNGAEISARLACDLSDRIAAIAAISGLYYPPFSPDLPTEPGCLGERAVPVLATHGTADDVIPYQGGSLGIDIPVSVRNVETEVLPDWAAHNGCAPTLTNEAVTANVDLLSYGGCADGAVVELYRIEGGAHVWPGVQEQGQPDPDVNDEINANDLLWAFFEAHPLVQPAQQTGPVPTATPQATPEATTAAPTATSQAVALPAAGGGTSDGTKGVASLAALLAGAGALFGAAWLLRARTRP